MKLVIVAERVIETPFLSIMSMIARLALRWTDVELAVRANTAKRPASVIELATEEVARICGATLAMYVPGSGPDARANIFNRDYTLVTGADLVLAFFTEGSDMGGGTGHVVKAALDRGVAVEAYSVSEDGTLGFLVADGGWREHEGLDDIEVGS